MYGFEIPANWYSNTILEFVANDLSELSNVF